MVLLSRPRFKASPRMRGNVGSGESATCRHTPLAREAVAPTSPIVSTPCRSWVPFFDLGFSKRPTGRTRPEGEDVRRPGIRASGFEGEGANRGDVSRPKQSGGRVTATDKKVIARGAGERSVRVFMRSRSRLRKSPRPGASERSEVAPGAGKEKKTGGPRQSARSVCLPTARSTNQSRPSGASAGLMRSRSRPQRPRTGSPSPARSAGTGQKRSTKCRRIAPVAAKRSSGAIRRQRGSPLGADGRGCQAAGGAERSPAPTNDGTREGGRGRTERQAVHQAGRERRRGATPATATPAAYLADR